MGKRAVEKTYRSRKWTLVLLVVFITTIGVFVPPLLSAWLFKAAAPLFIITGAEYVSVITLVVSAYFGFNVLQRKVEAGEASRQQDASKVEPKLVETKTETKTEVKTEFIKEEDGEA